MRPSAIPDVLTQTEDRTGFKIPIDKTGDPACKSIDILNLVPMFYEIPIGTWNLRSNAYKFITGISSDILGRIKAIYGVSIVDDDGYTAGNIIYDAYQSAHQVAESEFWAQYYRSVPIRAKIDIPNSRIVLQHLSLYTAAYTSLYEATGEGSQTWTPYNSQVLQKFSGSSNRGYILVSLNMPS